MFWSRALTVWLCCAYYVDLTSFPYMYIMGRVEFVNNKCLLRCFASRVTLQMSLCIVCVYLGKALCGAENVTGVEHVKLLYGYVVYCS